MNIRAFRVLSTLIVCLGLADRARAGVPAVFNIRDYGANGDAKTLQTAAISQAVDAAAKAGGGTVYLPPGQYLTGTIILQSHVTLELDAGATLLASQQPADYPLVDDVWAKGEKIVAPLIYAQDAENITITGRGTIDGQGQSWWAAMRQAQGRARGGPEQAAAAHQADVGRPQLIRLVRCKDVLLAGLSLKNSPEWNVHPLLCENVRVDGLTISAIVPSPNTDGINPESCKNVQILNCRIDVGDDCVTLKSGKDALGRAMGRPTENVTITNCVMLRGHGGVTIGSEMSGGVHNVVVSNCVFQGTDNGIRVKSQRGRGGIVEGFTATNIIMQDVPHPFTITTFYMGTDRPGDIYPVNEGTPRFRDFLFSNITIRGAKDAGGITGLKELAVENITLSNVHIQSATGFILTSTKEIKFQDVTIDTDKGPAVIERGSTQIDTTRLATHKSHEGVNLVDTTAAATQP